MCVDFSAANEEYIFTAFSLLLKPHIQWEKPSKFETNLSFDDQSWSNYFKLFGVPRFEGCFDRHDEFAEEANWLAATN